MNASGAPPIDAALAYAEVGWPVFPCHSIHASGCTCGRSDCASPAKHPRITRGFHAASTDRDAIERWWNRWPNSNIGIATGERSGLVVVDLDPYHDADATIGGLVARHGPLPDTRAVRTGSGGTHLYFAHPGESIRNDTGMRFGRGVDVRGDGGYIIAPPSRHHSGRIYTWMNHNAILQLPLWMLERLRPQVRETSVAAGPIPSPNRLDAWTRSALRREADLVVNAIEGTRNTTLNRAAFRLGQLAATDLLDSPTIHATLVNAARQAGLGEREATATIDSGLRAGLLQPRRHDGRGVA